MLLSLNIFQDASFLTALLNAIRDLLATDDDLRPMVPFCISARGQQGRNVERAILKYRGSDEGTVTQLMQYDERWWNQPDLFWQGPKATDFSRLIPEAQIVGWFMAGDLSDK